MPLLPLFLAGLHLALFLGDFEGFGEKGVEIETPAGWYVEGGESF